MDDDDRIIRQHLEGRSMRAIAKAQRTTVAEINEVIDRWAASAIDEKIRKNTLALELARFDELQEVFTHALSMATCSAVPWPPRLSSAAA
jgi:Tfp pilus assembly PilM family ATPase